MKVYRIMHIKEYELFQAEELDKLGGCFYGQTLPNNHRYKKNIKYLHFFKNKTAVDRYFRSVTFTKNNNYVLGTFDIPFKRLFLHGSHGFYMPSGYDSDYEIEREYALPLNKVKTEYLIDCEPIVNRSNTDDEIEK